MNPSKKALRTIKRIVKVNHAGEFGAIKIYQAQFTLARLFYKDLIPFLDHVLLHEIEHCKKFADAMPKRGTRPCYTMWLWSRGGYLLGFVSALMGRNMVMVCTEAVEDSVHRHMNDQLAFLQDQDDELKEIIESIKEEELEHLHYAQDRVKHNFFTKAIGHLISFATEVLIFLSTHGDSIRMKRDLHLQN